MRAIDYALQMSEDQLQASVEELLTRLGYLWFHDEDPRRNNAGLLDLIAVHPRTGFLLMVELKTQKGKVRTRQAEWLAGLQRRRRDHFYVAIWRPEHWRSGHIQQVLKQGAMA
jgi:hypothetical protein